MQLQLQRHYITQRYAAPIIYITLHYATATDATAATITTITTLHYTTLHHTNCTLKCNYNYTTLLHYTRLHYTIPRYSNQQHRTLQYATIHYTNYTTLQLQLVTTTPIQLQLQLHYTTLHPAVVVRRPLQPLQPLQKTQLQPPFGPSVDSLCHPWFTTTNLSYRFLIFETSATALCGTTGIYMYHHVSTCNYI